MFYVYIFCVQCFFYDCKTFFDRSLCRTYVYFFNFSTNVIIVRSMNMYLHYIYIYIYAKSEDPPRLVWWKWQSEKIFSPERKMLPWNAEMVKWIEVHFLERQYRDAWWLEKYLVEASFITTKLALVYNNQKRSCRGALTNG